MRNSQNFWDKKAGRYDCFMRKDAAAYEQMYELLRLVVRQKTVLELATGTGLIAKHIVRYADHIEAIDASQEMIEQAKQGVKSAKLYFSVQDMFHLPYADQSFDVVIVVNALHIVPEPEKALSEIRRVLKDDGVLVAPTFTHADNTGRRRSGRCCFFPARQSLYGLLPTRSRCFLRDGMFFRWCMTAISRSIPGISPQSSRPWTR